MNRLRGDRVIVDLSEVKDNKDPYKETGSGILLANDAPKDALLVKGTILRVGHEINSQDLKEGDRVYVKRSTGEKIYDGEDIYLFNERAIIGND